MKTKLHKVNAQLKEMKETELMLEEPFGAQLYTGPVCAPQLTHT